MQLSPLPIYAIRYTFTIVILLQGYINVDSVAVQNVEFIIHLFFYRSLIGQIRRLAFPIQIISLQFHTKIFISP